MGDWKPIETAPKDGTEILLWWPYWSNRATVGYWKHDRWLAENALTDNTGTVVDPQPTHWMPLPEPPKQ